MDRLRSLAARALRLARRARDLFPLTTAGLALGGVSALALVTLGIGEQDLLVVVIAGLGLALLALALGSVIAASLVVAWTLHAKGPGAPLRLECGHSGRSGFSIPSLWWAPLARLRWRWEDARAAVELQKVGWRLEERVTPLRRGDVDHIAREVTVEEPFGLARVTLRHVERRALRFQPSVGALRNIHVVRGLAGGDQLSHPEGDPSGDRIDMRRYADGDPIRYVLWKVFARSRRLVVRTPERAFAPSQQTIAYLVAGRGDGPAAGAARLVVEEGAMGGEWRLGADGSARFAEERGGALDLIVRSAHVAAGQEAAGLGGFLEAQRQGSARRVVIFVPPHPGPWLTRLAEAVAAHPHLAPEFVVCTDGIQRGPEPGRARRWFFHDPDEPVVSGPVPREELRRVLEALGALGGRCTLLDRSSGEVHPAESLHLRRVG
ncbi:MAG: DUF58 domain-containing protein [Alphaproteobacteria bacterium]|nr:DUF58 domain-containing protein [Alphaproteobacteria bacterium]